MSLRIWAWMAVLAVGGGEASGQQSAPVSPADSGKVAVRSLQVLFTSVGPEVSEEVLWIRQFTGWDSAGAVPIFGRPGASVEAAIVIAEPRARFAEQSDSPYDCPAGESRGRDLCRVRGGGAIVTLHEFKVEHDSLVTNVGIVRNTRHQQSGPRSWSFGMTLLFRWTGGRWEYVRALSTIVS
jgi:hypothetical protein